MTRQVFGMACSDASSTTETCVLTVRPNFLTAYSYSSLVSSAALSTLLWSGYMLWNGHACNGPCLGLSVLGIARAHKSERNCSVTIFSSHSCAGPTRVQWDHSSGSGDSSPHRDVSEQLFQGTVSVVRTRGRIPGGVCVHRRHTPCGKVTESVQLRTSLSFTLSADADARSIELSTVVVSLAVESPRTVLEYAFLCLACIWQVGFQS